MFVENRRDITGENRGGGRVSRSGEKQCQHLIPIYCIGFLLGGSKEIGAGCR
jgi:hypothetical protein